jgi:lipocalin-like protein
MMWLITFALLCLASASSKQDKRTKQLAGAWRLVSVEGQPPGVPSSYEEPRGMIIYDLSGWMSVQVASKGDRKPFAKGFSSGTHAEKVAAFDTYVAYYGTYTVNANAETITHHLEDNSYPGRQGAKFVRWFEFQGNDRVALTPVEDGKGGVIARKDATFRLLWERIK